MVSLQTEPLAPCVSPAAGLATPGSRNTAMGCFCCYQISCRMEIEPTKTCGQAKGTCAGCSLGGSHIEQTTGGTKPLHPQAGHPHRLLTAPKYNHKRALTSIPASAALSSPARAKSGSSFISCCSGRQIKGLWFKPQRQKRCSVWHREVNESTRRAGRLQETGFDEIKFVSFLKGEIWCQK